MAQKEALVVGVGDYAPLNKDKNLDLNGIDKDVGKMKKLLESKGFKVKTLFNKESLNLAQELERYSQLKSEDSFVFYYSGHGTFQKDTDGDEADGTDEALVLSDGEQNKIFLDDALFGYLNAISAKKLVLLDSCHSGTAFRTFDENLKQDLQSKTMDATNKYELIKTKAFRVQERTTLNGGEYIALSASQDNETSFATKTGSLFTNALYANLSDKDKSKLHFDDIIQNISQDIQKYASDAHAKAHHPLLSSSSTELKYSSPNDFLASKEVQEVTKTKEIKITGKKAFKEGELLSFTLDTNGNRGYITIYSMENNRPFIMYQSNNPHEGIFEFPKDFVLKKPIECYKSCSNCPSEESSLFVVLSQNLNSLTPMSSINPNNSQDPIYKKAFREREEGVDKIVQEVKFTIY
jgi:hypothetical protein